MACVGLQSRHGCVVRGTGFFNRPFEQVPLVAFCASLKFGGETMSEKMHPGQSGSTDQKGQKPADEQQKKANDQAKAGEQHEETGSSSNSMPGSGPG